MSLEQVVAAPDLLATIVAATRRIVDVRRATTPQADVDARASRRAPRAEAFRAALSRPDGFNIIAECKRRSPSRGVLRAAYDPASIATSYARGGAAAVSVLTEPTFFDGSLDHLVAVRSVVDLPILRKDFVVDLYQLAEARAAGADAILLIVAALEDDDLKRLLHAASTYGLAALVEVHDEVELGRAVQAGAEIIGVNNRNLRTLTVDVEASERLADRMPAGVVRVTESGLRTRRDLERLRKVGYNAFLIGERFMTAADPGGALAELLADGGGVR